MGIVGAGGSALLAQFLTHAQERKRWDHEEESRWQHDRRLLYGGFLREASTIFLFVARDLPKAEAALASLSEMLTELELIASSNVADAAGKVYGWATTLVEDVRRHGLPGTGPAGVGLLQDGWDKALTALRAEIGTMRVHARAELRIP
jgi:hypothetical protein